MNNKFFDRYTPIHFWIYFCLAPFPRDLAYMIAVFVEAVESTIFKRFIQEIEGPVNIMSDILFNLLGYEVGRIVLNKLQSSKWMH